MCLCLLLEYNRTYRRETSVAQPMTRTSSGPPDDEEEATEHLDDVADGCGCTEVWEYLSERRDADESSDEGETQASAEQRTDD
jgi:hypothetical protein